MTNGGRGIPIADLSPERFNRWLSTLWDDASRVQADIRTGLQVMEVSVDKDWTPIITRTIWRRETEQYAGRIAQLTLTIPQVVEQMERFPGLLSFQPPAPVSVKHRGLIYTNQLFSSGVEVLSSVQLLWAEGHFLCAGHCVRLLYEIVGALRHFQRKILARSLRSEEEANAADEKLQRLMLATNSSVRLPAGIDERQNVVSAQAFIDAGEAHANGFQTEYDFLCDISHPTFMHMYLYSLQWDHSWSNPIFVEEIHKCLERLVRAAENATHEISGATVEIYDACVPSIEQAIAESVNS